MPLTKITASDIARLQEAGLLTRLHVTRQPRGAMIDPILFKTGKWQDALSTKVSADLMGHPITAAFDPRKIGTESKGLPKTIWESQGLEPPEPTPTEADLIQSSLAAALTTALPSFSKHVLLRLEALLA